MNLILVIIDSLRKDHVGAYGNEWIHTPNLDSFFSESMRFTSAYPESLPTLPMRRSIHTGIRTFPFRGWKGQPTSYPLTTMFGSKVWIPGWTAIPWEQKTLAEHLNEYNYDSGYFTDCFHQDYAGMNFHRGFHAWEMIRGQEWDCWKTDPGMAKSDIAAKHFTKGMEWEKRKTWELTRYLTNNSHRQSEEDYFPAQVFRAATRWIEKNRDAENIFACVDCFDPHEPWDPPKHYRELYDPGYKGTEVIMPLYYDKADKYLTPEELNHMKAMYAGECSMVDRWFGFFMDTVRLLGLDKNSIIVVTSDHGHQLGEKNMTGKLPWGLMPCLLDLVMGIRHPQGEGAGKTCDAYAMNHDIMPTVLSMMGIDVPDQCEGENLWPVAMGKENSKRDHVSTIFKDYLWTANDSWALITRNNKTEMELYDIKKDPEYLKDVSADHPEVVEQMWKTLLEDAGGDIPIPEGASEAILEKGGMK